MDNIIETIEQRRSVRTFDSAYPLSDAEFERLRKLAAEATSPFEGGTYAVELRRFDIKGAFKPSTYGAITGAGAYFLMGMSDDPVSQLSLGYTMEQVVLEATAMGLGTCWIAATFNGTDFARAASFAPQTPLRIVMPVGHPAVHRRIVEKMTRFALGSAKRQPFNKLFDGDVDNWRMPLEMMRLAPSAKNSQPWRAVCTDTKVDFYYEPKTEAALIDMGIALSHFVLTARQLGHPGTLRLTADLPARDNLTPLATFE